MNKSYICYSVKELAYKISYDLLEEYFGECNNEIFCRIKKDKFEIAIYFEQDIFFIFDIYWKTGAFGDTSLICDNGRIEGKFPEGFQDIEEILPDEESEE